MGITITTATTTTTIATRGLTRQSCH